MDWLSIITALVVLILVLTLFTLALTIGTFSDSAVVKTDFSSDAKKYATAYYYLPESIIKINAIAKIAVVYNEDNTLTEPTLSNIIERRFTITTEMIADTECLLSLNYKPSALMSDEIKYGVNAKGLLETVNIATEDRTTSIITTLTQAPQLILGTSDAVQKNLESFSNNKNIVKIKEFTADFAIKASEILSTEKKIYWKLVLINDQGVDEHPKILDGSFTISSTEINSATSKLKELINGNSSSENTEISGILIRPLKNISLKIEPNGDQHKILPSNISIADSTKIVVVPINRTAFVKRINKITIQDGIILSNEINNPSSVEGFALIPINIAKALVSIPAQLIQFRYNNIKKSEELEKLKLNYDKAIQENQKFLLSKVQDIEKSKLDLQTSLLNSEKSKLDAQKALDEIKKQIEELKKKVS